MYVLVLTENSITDDLTPADFLEEVTIPSVRTPFFLIYFLCNSDLLFHMLII